MVWEYLNVARFAIHILGKILILVGLFTKQQWKIFQLTDQKLLKYCIPLNYSSNSTHHPLLKFKRNSKFCRNNSPVSIFLIIFLFNGYKGKFPYSLGCEADHALPSGAEVKNVCVWSYNSTSTYTFKASRVTTSPSIFLTSTR